MKEKRKTKNRRFWRTIRQVVLLAGLAFLCSVMILRERRELREKYSVVGFEAVDIAYVIDGDTVIVTRQDGTRPHVRLAGIDCEESVSKKTENTEKGRQASEFTRKLLPEGMTIYLQKDVSETDRYGRLVRYIWMELPEDSSDEKEVRAKMANAVLLEQDMAEPMDIAPDLLYSDLFHELYDQTEHGQPS